MFSLSMVAPYQVGIMLYPYHIGFLTFFFPLESGETMDPFSE